MYSCYLEIVFRGKTPQNKTTNKQTNKHFLNFSGYVFVTYVSTNIARLFFVVVVVVLVGVFLVLFVCFPPKTWEQLSQPSKKKVASEMPFPRYPISKVIVPVPCISKQTELILRNNSPIIVAVYDII